MRPPGRRQAAGGELGSGSTATVAHDEITEIPSPIYWVSPAAMLAGDTPASMAGVCPGGPAAMHLMCRPRGLQIAGQLQEGRWNDRGGAVRMAANPVLLSFAVCLPELCGHARSYVFLTRSTCRRRLQENFPEGIRIGPGAGGCRDVALPAACAYSRSSAALHGAARSFRMPHDGPAMQPPVIRELRN
jgi:hypothetical protein